MSKLELSRVELIEQNNLADELLPKLQSIVALLERINELSDQLPSEDDLDGLEKSVANVASSLASIPELMENLPAPAELDELQSKSASIAENLAAAGE